MMPQLTQMDRNQSSRRAVRVGKVPAAFIVTAMLNFAIGAGLGGLMSVNQALWPAVGLVHGELNPFGWLTMLIYGMTYAVLSLLAGLELPWPALAWIQLICAELGVVALVVSVVHRVVWLLHVGLGLQALAPLLFLVNILSAVIVCRRRNRRADLAAPSATVGEDVVSENEDAEFRRFFGKPAFAKPTDAVGQRGTELALMVFLVAAVWTFAASFGQPAGGYDPPLEPTLLTYYGWAAGTVLAVTLHLYPRYAGRAVLAAWEAQLGQALWSVGMLGIVLGTLTPTALALGERITGIAIGWMAVLILRAALALRETAMPSRLAWVASWCFALALGIVLTLGLDPLSLAALHLLFLGWITTLAYGVGYTLFPYLLGRQLRSQGLAAAQIVVAVVGALLMVISFSQLGHAGASTFWRASLGAGGVTATAGFLLFVAQWAVARQLARLDQSVSQPKFGPN